MYMYICVCLFVCVCVCVYIYIYICLYIYLHTYICIYMLIHIHTYIYNQRKDPRSPKYCKKHCPDDQGKVIALRRRVMCAYQSCSKQAVYAEITPWNSHLHPMSLKAEWCSVHVKPCRRCQVICVYVYVYVCVCFGIHRNRLHIL